MSKEVLFDTIEYKLPTEWISPIFNGDISGLDEDDIEKFESWMELHNEELGEGHWSLITDDENDQINSDFEPYHDARDVGVLATDCATFVRNILVETDKNSSSDILIMEDDNELNVKNQQIEPVKESKNDLVSLYKNVKEGDFLETESLWLDTNTKKYSSVIVDDEYPNVLRKSFTLFGKNFENLDNILITSLKINGEQKFLLNEEQIKNFTKSESESPSLKEEGTQNKKIKRNRG